MMEYIDLKHKPGGNELVCEYRVEPFRRQIFEAIAGESSIGSWTEFKTMKPRVAKRLKPHVFSINQRGRTIKIAYPLELFESGNIPQLLSSVAGNIFGMKMLNSLRLEDLSFPRSYVNSFKGPELGISEIKKLLNVRKRPLVGTIVKPKVGLNSKEHARVAYEAWMGGLDLVKCDENLTSQKFNMFEANIRETLKMLERAERETGEKKIYVPNVTGETKEMVRRARLVKESGGNCVMVDIITTGWGALHTLRNENLGLIIHAHRAGHGMFTKGKYGMSMLTIAKIARLIGVSQIHTGTAGVGKMKGDKGETERINSFLRSKWFSIKPVFPIASGGLHAGSVPKLVELLGNDIIIQAGGGVHGLGTRTGATSMRQAVDAVMNGILLRDYAKTHKELRLAIEKWGIVG